MESVPRPRAGKGRSALGVGQPCGWFSGTLDVICEYVLVALADTRTTLPWERSEVENLSKNLQENTTKCP